MHELRIPSITKNRLWIYASEGTIDAASIFFSHPLAQGQSRHLRKTSQAFPPDYRMATCKSLFMAPEAGRCAMSNNQSAPPSLQCDKSGPCTNGVFTLYSANHFQSLPEPMWLIDGVLPGTGLACVYGPSGLGKSFICFDMAATVALGRPWFGHPTKQTRVVYVPLEGRSGFSRRIRAWAVKHGINVPDDVRFLKEPFGLNSNNDAEMLAGAINQCGGAGLIIIDTLNKAAHGADENSSAEMGRIIAGATTLQELTSALVLLVHHPGKDGSRGLRGHSSLHAALDSIIEIKKDGELIRWNLVKSKDGEDGINHAFRLLEVEIGCDGTGKAIKSCVVQEVEGATSYKKQSEPRGPNQQLILAAVLEIFVQEKIHDATENSDQVVGIPIDDVLSGVKNEGGVGCINQAGILGCVW
jgi:hypothetical protein